MTMLAGVTVRADDGRRYSVGPVTTNDLGTMGGRESLANDINNAGNVVGWSHTAAGVKHAFLHRAGFFRDVGFALGSVESEARGLNNADVVVGYSSSANDVQAFRWFSGMLVQLDDTSPNWDNMGSVANAISDTGLIAGQRGYFIDGGISDWEATVWSDDFTHYSLSGRTYPWSSYPYDINDDGYVVGYDMSAASTVRWHFDYDASPSERVPGFGIPWDSASEVSGINRAGAVVGHDGCCNYDDPISGLRQSAAHAMYWNGLISSVTDLGVLPTGFNSSARDINNSGFIAGYADRLVSIPGGLVYLVDSAFIYHRHFGMHALPKLPSTTARGACRAEALNDINSNYRVQVAGYCDTRGPGSPRHAVRWDVTLR